MATLAETILAQKAGYSSSVVIAELTPAAPGKKPRVLTLVGSALPFMGAEWGFENNVITTWYPGNAIEATQQMLGPRELPSTWEGEWKRTLMGRAPSTLSDENGALQRIVAPHILRDVLEDIGRSGQRLRVTWAVRGTTFVGGDADSPHEEDMTIIREGRIKSAKFPHDKHTDIRWTVEFHWLGRGGQQDRAASTREDSDMSKIANALIASVNALAFFTQVKAVNVKSNIRLSASSLTLGQLEKIASLPKDLTTQLTRQLQQNVSKFKHVGEIATKLRSAPLQMANAVLDLSRNTMAVANDFVDRTGRIGMEQRSLQSKVSDLTRATAFTNNVSNAAAVSARRGAELLGKVTLTSVSGPNRGALSARDNAGSRAGDVTAVYVAHAGDTPQSVSRKFYGNADHGVDILKANRLPWFTPTFRPGQILVIPTLTNAPRGA